MRTVEEIKADIDGANVAERPFACSPTSHKTWQGWKLTQLKAELLDTLTASIPLDRLSEICSAERDGRLVVLPCKVGDRIYIRDSKVKSGIRVTKLESYLVYPESPTRIYVKSTATSAWYPIKDVFEAREAAEEKMKGGKA